MGAGLQPRKQPSTIAQCLGHGGEGGREGEAQESSRNGESCQLSVQSRDLEVKDKEGGGGGSGALQGEIMGIQVLPSLASGFWSNTSGGTISRVCVSSPPPANGIQR